MNPNPDPQPESTVEPQKPLPELLDAYDRRVESAKIFSHVATENYRTDVAALVKALRELWDEFRHSNSDLNPEVYMPMMNDQERKLTAILNQGRK